MPTGTDEAGSSPPPARAGVAPRSPRRIILFLVFGGFTTVLSWCIYVLLLYVVSYRAAYTLAYGICIFVSYYLHATFVFKEKLHWSNALRYPLVSLVLYLLGLGLLYLLIEVAGVNKILAPWFVLVLTIPVSYQLSRYATRRPVATGPSLST